MLSITVHGDKHIPVRCIDARCKRSLMSEVSAQFHDAHAGILRGKRRKGISRAVGRSVIDVVNFEFVRGYADYGGQTGMAALHDAGFIEHRDYYIDGNSSLGEQVYLSAASLYHAVRSRLSKSCRREFDHVDGSAPSQGRWAGNFIIFSQNLKARMVSMTCSCSAPVNMLWKGRRSN